MAANSTTTTMTTTTTTTSKIQPTEWSKKAKESIWNEFSQLAMETRPLNLSMGMPDYEEAVPSHLRHNLVKALTSGGPMLNQYTRGFGHPRLVKALAGLYTKLLGHDIDPMDEILVTVGAYEALYCVINAYIGNEDEVIVIEPFFDCYETMVKLAGGTCKYIPLVFNGSCSDGGSVSSADWTLDMDALERLAGPRTKMLLLNTPHNPIGKVFSLKELEKLAQFCERHDLLVLSDEVYEHLVIDGRHTRIASLPGMWKRTITVGSAGKTFSATGWKVGWCYGPRGLMESPRLFHQNCIYTCPTPLQEAVAESLEIETQRLGTKDSYWAKLVTSLKEKRDFTSNLLVDAKMKPTIPEAGYFIMADTTLLAERFDLSKELGATRDHKFVRCLSRIKKIQGIPASTFYSIGNKNLAENYMRLCYFKNETSLLEAERLIKELWLI